MRAVRSLNTQLENLSVQYAVVEAPFRYREDDLYNLLDGLKVANAVVIVESGGTVTGIVTRDDAMEFLRNRMEDLMRVEDIEFAIKELIKAANRASMNESGKGLPAVVIEIDGQRNKPAVSRKPKPFEELNLGDSINLLMSKEV